MGELYNILSDNYSLQSIYFRDDKNNHTFSKITDRNKNWIEQQRFKSVKLAAREL